MTKEPNFKPIKNLAEATAALYSLKPQTHLKHEAALRQAEEFFHLLGDPQNDLKVIHIAGTSGKSSVAYYLTALLVGQGKTVGTHVSPHVYDLRERAMLNGKLPPLDVWLAAVNKVLAKSNQTSPPSPSEINYIVATTAIAFELFARAKVDYAVIETGVGGLYDTTNVIRRSDKLAVITRLGLDHTELLGDTLEKIARQKAGIFPFDGLAIYLRIEPAVEKVFKEMAQLRHTKLLPVTPSLDDTIELKNAGKFQQENASLAIVALEQIAKRDNWKIDQDKLRQSLENLTIPGRMEKIESGGHQVILDGAHNPQKMQALLESLPKQTQKPIFIVAAKQGKAVEEMLDLLKGHVDSLVATQFSGGGNTKFAKLAFPSPKLALMAEKAGLKVVGIETNPGKALQRAKAVAKTEQTIVVTGSLYLLNDIKQQLIHHLI